jgi:hypothetical protein
MPIDSTPFLSTASYGMALSCDSSLSLLDISATSSRRATPPKETAKYPVERTTYVRNRSGTSQSRILSFNSLGQEELRGYLGFCSSHGCNLSSHLNPADCWPILLRIVWLFLLFGSTSAVLILLSAVQRMESLLFFKPISQPRYLVESDFSHTSFG